MQITQLAGESCFFNIHLSAMHVYDQLDWCWKLVEAICTHIQYCTLPLQTLFFLLFLTNDLNSNQNHKSMHLCN